MRNYWNPSLLLCLFVVLIFSPGIKAQNFLVNYINTDNYPEIEAGFIATDDFGGKIFNSKISDFSVLENDKACKILEVTNPNQKYNPVSIVMMVDISLSMRGSHIDYVKEGLTSFINQIPLEKSEIAIAGFSDQTYVLSDFTQSKDRLITALNKLNTIKGTDFDYAFIAPAQGAFAIGNNSRYRKVIVFITDGLGSTNAERVSAMAVEQGFTIFTLNVGYRIPNDLKTITQTSGGQYFEKIWSQSHFKNAATAIFQQLECIDYGTVKWLAGLNCDTEKHVKLSYKKQKVEFNIQVPKDKVGKIEVNPSLIQFGVGKVGKEQIQNISIAPRNIPVTIQSLGVDTSSSFKITDSIQFPVHLQPGEVFKSKLKFTATESGLYSGNLKVTSAECPDMNVLLRAGGEEQIKLLFPVGGETFVIGEDTSVLWEGVKRTQPVDVAYKMHETEDWKYLDKADNFRYWWNLPLQTSNEVQVKVSPNKFADENLEPNATLDASNTIIYSVFYSPDGNIIITTDKDEFITTWNAQSGKIITSLGGYEAKKAIIEPGNRILIFLKDETFVWDLESKKQVGRTNSLEKRVQTSYILPDGHEVLSGGNVSIDPAKNARIWSGIYPYKTFLLNQPDAKWASFTPDGRFIVSLDNKNQVKIFVTGSAKLLKTFTFKELVSSVIISPDGTKALINLPEELCMLDLTNTSELYRTSRAMFKQFTPGGTHFIISREKSISFMESGKGNEVLRIQNPRFYKVSPLSGYLVHNSRDSLYLFNLKEGKNIIGIPGKSVKQASFNSNESKVYVLTMNNTIEIYSTSGGDFMGVIEGFSNKIKNLVCNPGKLELALLMEDNRIEVWSPATNSNIKGDVSGKFSIISPKPAVIDTIRFNSQTINASKEVYVQKFATNATNYPITIQNVEIKGKDKDAFRSISNTFPVRMAANSQIDKEFSFNPDTIGEFNALAVTYTHTDTFYTVMLGNGVRPRVKPLLKNIDFGAVKVGTYKDSLASLLVNIGHDSLVIHSIKNIGPDESQFKVLSSQSYKLGRGDTLKTLVRFNPLLRGKTTTALLLVSSDLENQVVLQGEGWARREIVITGITRNSADSIPLQARVEKIDLESATPVEELNTGTDGRYMFKLSADRNYGIVAQKEQFISVSLNVDLRSNVPADTIFQDIYLTEIKPGTIIRLNNIFFETNNATLLPTSQADLKRLLDIILMNKQFNFEIHGHTDAIGADAYNLNLSKARATAVMNYLVNNGVPKNKLSIRYFGKNNPIAGNSTEEGRALNRRVELKVVK